MSCERWARQSGVQHIIRDDTTYWSGDDLVHWVVERRLEGTHEAGSGTHNKQM